MIHRSEIRRLIIREIYNTKLSQLYEQAPPDPAAAGVPPVDPLVPPVDPAAAAAVPAPVTPPAPAIPPDPTIPPAPAVPPDPLAGAVPLPGAPAVPPIPAAAPVPGAPPATPPSGVGAAGANAKKKSIAAPDPEGEPMKVQLNKALMKATKTDDSLAVESLRRKSMRFLLEADDKPKIDIGVYADEVARLIKNYTSLVDIKKNVITQAEKYLDDAFNEDSEDLKKKLKDLLRTKYQISLERRDPPGESYAVGAGGSGSGGGA